MKNVGNETSRIKVRRHGTYENSGRPSIKTGTAFGKVKGSCFFCE